jgi:hypothetical protein
VIVGYVALFQAVEQIKIMLMVVMAMVKGLDG